MIVRSIDDRIKYSLEPALPTLKDTTAWDSLINNYKNLLIPASEPIETETYNFTQVVQSMGSSTQARSGYVTITRCGIFIWVYNSNPRNGYYPVITTSPGTILSNCHIHTNGSYQIGYQSSRNCIVTNKAVSMGYVG